MLSLHTDITELIGRTPLVRLNRLSREGDATVYGKVEYFNPGGSVKDRICLNMINEAERQGRLKPGGTIVEPTSGNTGIGLALIAAIRGYKLILVMPESMSMDGEIDAFVTAVGTGGTITGCGEYFKQRKPGIKVIAVEPAGSPVLSGGDPGPHRIQGIGAGFIPKVLNRSVLDGVITITDEEAYQTAKLLAKKEGLLVGISSGANVAAAQKVAAELGPDKSIVTVLCDTGERYISIEKYFNI